MLTQQTWNVYFTLCHQHKQWQLGAKWHLLFPWEICLQKTDSVNVEVCWTCHTNQVNTNIVRPSVSTALWSRGNVGLKRVRHVMITSILIISNLPVTNSEMKNGFGVSTGGRLSWCISRYCYSTTSIIIKAELWKSPPELPKVWVAPST